MGTPQKSFSAAWATSAWASASSPRPKRASSAGEAGSLVTLLCDSGDRYSNSYYDDAWLEANGLDPAPFEPAIEAFLQSGRLDLDLDECHG